jgi:serine/threonine protein kinase
VKLPLKEEQISVVCREALKGLAYLHERNIVHRDIKGGNIMINFQGEVKLADFGVSAQLTESINKKNTFVGTPFWMSPEVIMQTQHDGKADIWSLGITAIEMAELVPPHSTVHPMRLLFLVPKEDPPKLQDQSSSRWTPLFHSFIETCLVKDPLRRPSASELLKHPFVNTSLSVADVLHPLVLQATSMRSAKSSSAEQFDSVLMPKGIPERVQPFLGGEGGANRANGGGGGHSSDESQSGLDTEFQEPDVGYASVIYREPARDAPVVDAPAAAQPALSQVHLDFPPWKHETSPQDTASLSLAASCSADDERAAAAESIWCACLHAPTLLQSLFCADDCSLRSDLGEFNSILETCGDCLPCFNVRALPRLKVILTFPRYPQIFMRIYSLPHLHKPKNVPSIPLCLFRLSHKHQLFSISILHIARTSSMFAQF